MTVSVLEIDLPQRTAVSAAVGWFRRPSRDSWAAALGRDARPQPWAFATSGDEAHILAPLDAERNRQVSCRRGARFLKREMYVVNTPLMLPIAARRSSRSHALVNQRSILGARLVYYRAPVIAFAWVGASEGDSERSESMSMGRVMRNHG